MDKNLKVNLTLQATGKSFELNNTKFLDISLESTENIKVLMQSIPKIITITLEKADAETADETTLILKGLEKNKTYYKFTDSFSNKEEFITDDFGIFQFQSDLKSSHTIFIKETLSTIYIKEDGWYNNLVLDPTIGDWNPVTRLATLKINVADTIEVATDPTKPLTLDGKGYTVTFSTGIGVFVPSTRHNVLVKNFVFVSCVTGVYFNTITNNCIVENCTFIDNYIAILINEANFNIVRNNSIRSSLPDTYGINLYSDESCNNTIENNEILFQNINDTSGTNVDNVGITLDRPIFTKVRNNRITFSSNTFDNDSVYLTGIILTDAMSSTIEQNQITIKGTVITNSYSELITISLDDSYGNFIRNNLLRVINNSISDSTSADIVLVGIYLYSGNHGNTLSSNTIFVNFNTLTNVASFICALIYFDGGSDSNIIENNILTDCQGNGITFNGSSDACLITNNLIANNVGYGLLFGDTEDGNNQITRNIFRNNGLGGLYISDDNLNNSVTMNNFENAPGFNAFVVTPADNNYFNSNFWNDYNHLTPCYEVNNVIDCNPLSCPVVICIPGAPIPTRNCYFNNYCNNGSSIWTCYR